MATAKTPSTKKIQIDKANASMVAFLATAAFIAVFSLVASRALLGQRSYQSRLITEKKKALAQLKSNNQAATQLVDSYKAFVSAPNNIIGGSPTGSGDRDGDNAKIVLDALPSKYDFPALATSLEKLLASKNYKIESITGTDDEINQSAASEASAAAPVEIPFEVAVSGNFDTAQGVLDIFQHSIRPIKITTLGFSGGDNTLKIQITGLTYYQPQKTVKIIQKVVK